MPRPRKYKTLRERNHANYERHKATWKAESKARYARNREQVLAAEREKLVQLKEDPVAYQNYLEHKRALYRARRAAGKIQSRPPSKIKWEANNRELLRGRQNLRRKKAREEAIAAYGGKCACCGEAAIEFLCIDHVNGGGRQHRLSLRPTDRREFCAYLKKTGYSAEFRVLCHNCNQALGLYGYCPHQGVVTSRPRSP